jgi:hypothetical protein
LDFSRDVPSVRAGALLSNRRCEAFARAHSMPAGQWNAHICVEEPFDRSNAARAVCKREAFDDILREVRNAREDLRDRGISLSDLM